jgi:hypothetical protein
VEVACTYIKTSMLQIGLVAGSWHMKFNDLPLTIRHTCNPTLELPRFPSDSDTPVIYTVLSIKPSNSINAQSTRVTIANHSLMRDIYIGNSAVGSMVDVLSRRILTNPTSTRERKWSSAYVNG